MPASDPQHPLDLSIGQVEETILPGISLMLGTLMDATEHARPGADADRFAVELRMLALQLDTLTRQVEAVVPSSSRTEDHRASATA